MYFLDITNFSWFQVIIGFNALASLFDEVSPPTTGRLLEVESDDFDLFEVIITQIL